MKKFKYILFTLIISFLFISNTYAETDINAEFCTGAVQGVFTTLGWVFFFAKILIPIILIIIGTIDFGKAVVNSKPEEEVKKTLMSLVKRAIAGIVIFFTPALLSLVVDLLNGGDLYKNEGSTFANCTKCMLNPTDNCASLGGK